jgi:peptidoglycan hydrolase-like protein with peptidoglycan-binding domain
MKIRRLIGLCSLAVLLSLHVAPLEYGYSALATDVPEPPDETQEYYVKTFLISAYYSPLPDQQKYATGSYASDIYLNGNGTHGADGTPVFPGMVACPKYTVYEDGSTSGYNFGTKFYIPGIGATTCHDRGGAIVKAGARSDAPYDRLDIWMGHGDEGLQRALNWGKRTVDVMVYGVNPTIQDEVYFDAYMAVEDFVQSTILSPLHFGEDIYYGTESDEVEELVNYLRDWGYFDGESTRFYGADVAQAIFDFQTDFDIVSDASEMGAGHFGIKTRSQFDRLLKDEEAAYETIRLQRGSVLMNKYTDLYDEEHSFVSALSLGDSGSEVTKLQEELQRMGLLYSVSGSFDEVTAHAVFKFQQIHGLVADKEDPAAGYVGPATRAALNSVIAARYDAKSLMAYQREEYQNGAIQLALPATAVAFTNED